jgi:hypothetical protein
LDAWNTKTPSAARNVVWSRSASGLSLAAWLKNTVGMLEPYEEMLHDHGSR